MLDLENQPGRGDFRQKVLGQDGQNSRSQSRRRRRLNKVHKINGLCVLYHFRATSFLMFIQNRRNLASDGFGTLQSLTCSTSVEDRGTGRSWQPKEPLPFWSFWSCLKKNDMRVACSVTACSCHRECLTKLPSFDLHVVFRLEAE